MRGLDEAIYEGALLRVRPILMTAFAFILGVVPLMIASGSGSGARRSLGTAVFFGMVVATIFGVIIAPGLFALIEGSGKKTRELENSKTRDTDEHVEEGSGHA